MDEKKVLIYDPEETPFGALSNNAKFPMYINDKTWPTVTNYILSNMLIVPLYREMMQNAPIDSVSASVNIAEKVNEILANVFVTTGKHPTKSDEATAKHIVTSIIEENKFGIYDRYEFFLEQEHFSTILSAAEKAYSARLENNAEMRKTLINTGMRPILYNSANKFLGMGPDGKGMNIIGLVLMQLRKLYRLGKTEQKEGKKLAKKEKQLIKLYKAYVFLINELEADSDISEYFNVSALEIPEENLKCFESEDEILKKILNNNLPFIKKELEEPGYMAKYLYENRIKENEAFLRKTRVERILYVYTLYVISQKYPNMPKEDVEKAAEQLILAAPSSEEYNTLKNNIVTMYYEGKLDEEVTDLIKEYLQDEREEERTKEEEESYRTSASSDDDDPIKQSFSEKNEKQILAKNIEKHTGVNYKKYMKKSLKKLKKLNAVYVGDDIEKFEANNKAWLLQYKLKNGRKVLIKRVTGEKPSLKDIGLFLQKHNRKNKTEIKPSQVFVDAENAAEKPVVAPIAGSWTVKIKHADGRTETLETLYSRPNEAILNDIAKRLNYTEPIHVSVDGGSDVKNNITYIYSVWSPVKEEVEEDEIIKPVGDPIMIFPIVEQNQEEYKQFSPLFNDFFVVDDLQFPYVSMFITTMLMTQVGIKPFLSRTATFKRGMSLQNARKEFIDEKGDFLPIDEAVKKYEAKKYETFKELMYTFAKIAIDVKFKNVTLKNLLQLTGNATLIWNDPHNIFLGAGTAEKPGENFVGKLLMNLREEIANTRTEKVTINYSEIRNFLDNDVFVKEWAKKRISDMCFAVSKVYNNAKSRGYEEELTPPFIEKVLDIIYAPCTKMLSMANLSFTTRPTDEFILHIRGCGNFPSKSLEIDRKIEEKKRDILSSEKDEFHIPIATRKEIEKRLMEEWNAFANNLLGEKDEEFIAKKVEELRLQQKARAMPEDSKKLFKERLKLWSSLQNKSSKQEMKKALIAFNSLQQKMITDQLKGRLTPEKINSINNKIAENKAELFDLQKQKKEIDRTYKFLSEEICQIYWERIVYMLHFLIKHTKESTEENIRKSILSLEKLNSVARDCELPYKIKEDKCIVSALYNILKNLDVFLSEMEIEHELSIEDIKLAEKIIIGGKKKGKRSRDDELKESSDPILEETAEKDEEDPREKLPGKEQPFDPKEEKEIIVEDDDNELQDEVFDYDDAGETEVLDTFRARFGMKGKSVNLSKHTGIESIIRDLTNNKPLNDVDELISAFKKSVEVIKNVSINSEIKTNRINFFATLA